MGVQIPHEKGLFWGKGSPIVKYRDCLPWAVQKQLNRSICNLGCGLGWAEGSTSSIIFAKWGQCTQFQSYSPGGANVPTWEDTLVPPGEYDWTVRLWWRCSLMSNYFDHLYNSLLSLHDLLFFVGHAFNEINKVRQQICHNRRWLNLPYW